MLTLHHYGAPKWNKYHNLILGINESHSASATLEIMSLTNHALAGSIIALVVNEPLIALSLAFASHFLLDALPHFGYPGNKGYGEAIKHKLSYIVTGVDVVLLVLVLGALALTGNGLAVMAGLVAAAPDAIGLLNFLIYEKHGRKPGAFFKVFHVKFHRAIQRYERPWGIWVEVAAFVGLLPICINLLG